MDRRTKSSVPSPAIAPQLAPLLAPILPRISKKVEEKRSSLSLLVEIAKTPKEYADRRSKLGTELPKHRILDDKLLDPTIITHSLRKFMAGPSVEPRAIVGSHSSEDGWKNKHGYNAFLHMDAQIFMNTVPKMTFEGVQIDHLVARERSNVWLEEAELEPGERPDRFYRSPWLFKKIQRFSYPSQPPLYHDGLYSRKPPHPAKWAEGKIRDAGGVFVVTERASFPALCSPFVSEVDWLCMRPPNSSIPDYVHTIRFTDFQRPSAGAIDHYIPPTSPRDASHIFLSAEWKTFKLPGTIRRVYIEYVHAISDTFPLTALPKDLDFLSIDRTYHRRLEVGDLPAQLQSLAVGDKYEWSFGAGVIPPTVKELVLQQPLSLAMRSVMPPALEILELGERYGYIGGAQHEDHGVQTLHANWLPPSIRSLRVNAQFYEILEIEDDAIPPNVVDLALENAGELELNPLALPDSVQKMTVPISWLIDLHEEKVYQKKESVADGRLWKWRVDRAHARHVLTRVVEEEESRRGRFVENDATIFIGTIDAIAADVASRNSNDFVPKRRREDDDDDAKDNETNKRPTLMSLVRNHL